MVESDFRVDGDSTRWDRDAFFKAAVQPGFPDKMAFVLEVPEPLRQEGRSFSEDGFEALNEQMKSFVAARLLGHWRKDEFPPYEMTVELNVRFKKTPQRVLENGDSPWWSLVDEGKNPIDASYRPRFEP
jgi:hypothetical protein